MNKLGATGKLENGQGVNRLAHISRALPNELMAIIFEIACLASEYIPNRTRVRQEVRISMVNRHWRNVALATPQLWRRIRMRLSYRYRNAQMAKEYISRSRALTLDITLMIDAEKEDDPEAIALFRLFSLHIRRWSQLRLTLMWPSDFHSLIGVVGMSEAPRLKLFDVGVIHHGRRREEYVVDHTQFFCGGTPSLTHASFRCFKLRACPPSLTSLTHLRYYDPHGGLNYADLSSFLNSLRALKYLMLQGIYFNAPAYDIVLPSLLILHIDFTGGADFVSLILGKLHAPNLQDIILEEFFAMPSYGMARHLPSGNASMAPRFPSLHSLTTSSHHPDDNNEFALFWTGASHAFPNITNIILASHSLSFLKFISLRTLPMPWPDLQTVTVTAPDRNPLFGETLCRSMQVRNELGYPIRKIQLPFTAMTSLTNLSDWVELQMQPEVEETTLYRRLATGTRDADSLHGEPPITITDDLAFTNLRITDLLDIGYDK